VQAGGVGMTMFGVLEGILTGTAGEGVQEAREITRK
jgi:hypothetical protein